MKYRALWVDDGHTDTVDQQRLHQHIGEVIMTSIAEGPLTVERDAESITIKAHGETIWTAELIS